MITALVFLLTFGKPDTLSIEYLQDKEWKKGFIVTEVIDRTESVIHYVEPSAWLDINKQPIEKPKKHFIK